MKRATVHRTLQAGLVVAIALAARTALTADKIPNDHLLPPQTYAYVTVPSVEELKTKFHESLMGRLLSDPKMADFLGDIHKKFAEFSQSFQQQHGLKLEDVLAIPQGEVSLAVLLPTDAKKLAVAALLDFGSSGSTVDAVLEKATNGLEKHGFKKSTHETEGSKVVVFLKEKPKDKDEDKEEKGSNSDKEEPDFGSQFVYVVKGHSLIVSTSTLAIRDVLRRWEGKHGETLADVPAYKSISDLGKKSGTPVLVWYLNPVTLVQAFMKSAEVDQGVSMAMAMLPLLGLSSLKGIGGTVHLVTPEYDSETQTLIYVEPPVSGVLNVFHFPVVNEAPPSWVTEDTTGYVALNWDVEKAYSAVESLVDQFLGPGATAQKLDEWATEEPKVQLKKDVIDNLDGMIHVVIDSPDSSKPTFSRILVAVGVKDAKKMKSVLDKVSKMPNFPGSAHDFRGEVIYNLEGIPGFGDANHTMGAAVVKDNVMISNDVSRIEQAIIGDKTRRPLAESEKYQRIAKHFPSKTSIVWYQEQDTPQLRGLYDMVRSGKLAEQIGAISPTIAKILEGIHFNKLPEFDALRKYLPPSGTYVVPHANGAMIVGFQLKSEK